MFSVARGVRPVSTPGVLRPALPAQGEGLARKFQADSPAAAGAKTPLPSTQAALASEIWDMSVFTREAYCVSTALALRHTIWAELMLLYWPANTPRPSKRRITRRGLGGSPVPNCTELRAPTLAVWNPP